MSRYLNNKINNILNIQINIIKRLLKNKPEKLQEKIGDIEKVILYIKYLENRKKEADKFIEQNIAILDLYI